MSDSRILDRAVERAHALRHLGPAYHPYHLATNLGIVALLVFSVSYAARRPGMSVAGFFGAFASMQVTYAVARVVKRRVFGIAARSFLQDAVLFVLPSFAAASVLFGNDLRASLDLAGLDLALGVTFIRLGCFFGGCCYGRVASWGVAYRPEHLVATPGCRSFTPGPLPPGRVIPMQLIESAFHATSTIVLTCLSERGIFRGRLLAVYLLAYGTFRLIADRFRDVSARPRRAGLSEAQWVAMGVMGISALVLVMWRAP